MLWEGADSVEVYQLGLYQASVRVLGVMTGFMEECMTVCVFEVHFRGQCFCLVAGVTKGSIKELHCRGL